MNLLYRAETPNGLHLTVVEGFNVKETQESLIIKIDRATHNEIKKGEKNANNYNLCPN